MSDMDRIRRNLPLLLAAMAGLTVNGKPRRAIGETAACRHGIYGTSRSEGARVDRCLCGATRHELGPWVCPDDGEYMVRLARAARRP